MVRFIVVATNIAYLRQIRNAPIKSIKAEGAAWPRLLLHVKEMLN